MRVVEKNGMRRKKGIVDVRATLMRCLRITNIFLERFADSPRVFSRALGQALLVRAT